MKTEVYLIKWKGLLLACMWAVSAIMLAQNITVRGTVTDENGMTVIGATVIVQGVVTHGSVTDVDGKYTLLNVPPDGSLVFSYVGMKSQTIPINGRETINIIMAFDTQVLEEVVAIGYGTMRKKDLTGAVTRVTVDDKSLQANVTLSQVLAGVSGINFQARGGAGGEPSFSIRGQNTLSTSSSPLIVVDGIIYDEALSSLNISDVEAIDVLKDASSAAVYGSKSKNGVLLITTKKGKNAKPTISVDAYYGIQDITNTPMRVMNGEEFAIRMVDWQWENDIYKWYATNPTSAEGRPVRPDITNRELVSSYLKSPEEQNNYLNGTAIDWVDEVTRIAPMQNYNISLSGGAENSTFYLSGSYSDVKGIQLNDQLKKFTLRSNLESKVNNWLTIGMNLTYTLRDDSGEPASLHSARVATPWANNHIGKDDYDIYLTNELFQAYPLAFIYTDNSNLRHTLFGIGRAEIDFPFLKGLKYEFNISDRYNTAGNYSYWNSKTPSGMANNGRARKIHSESNKWLINNILSYTETFGDHYIYTTLLYSRDRLTGNASTLNSAGFDNETLGYNNIGAGLTPSVSSSAYEENNISYMARINYSYLSRYLITGTVRRDGFSGFGSNHKWATFPSLSLGWVLTEEPFMKNPEFYLKMRLSYGVTGNQGSGRYASMAKMSSLGYVFGSEYAVGLYPSSLSNMELGWERSTSTNLGIDFSLLKNRLSGSVDMYNSRIHDVLVRRELPPSAGYSNVWSNIAELATKGLEIELRSVNFNNKDFTWNTKFIFGLDRDKITKLYGGENDQDAANGWFVGESIQAIYDYKIEKIWTEEEFFAGKVYPGWYPGQFKLADLDNSNSIDPTNDRTIIGYKSPAYRFSIENVFRYKNVSLSFFINSIQGGKNRFLGENAENINPLIYYPERQNVSAVNPYWRPDAPTTNTTGIYNNPPVWGGIYQSRSFVRLQDVSLAYALPKQLTEKLKVNFCQVYLSSKNPYVWTKWQGWDPEIGTAGSGSKTGYSSTTSFPALTRNVIMGIKFNF
jgi:TonB-linked SusC/RagA family outer membrane protein